MTRKTSDEIAASLSKTLRIDSSSIKKAYEGDDEGLRQIFNLVSESRSHLTKKSSLAGLWALCTATLLIAASPIAVLSGALFGIEGSSAWQDTKEIAVARQTVLTRLGKNSPK